MSITESREGRATLAATLLCACMAAAACARASADAGVGPSQAPVTQPAATQPTATQPTATQPAATQSAASPPKASAATAQESADRIIAVAHDVSPEWASSLQKVRERDPAGFERATGVLAKRLKALAVLKDRKPQLYALRVEELRIQGEVVALADQWRSAISTGRTEDAAATEQQLRSKVGAMVDLNLRSRAMELAELDEVMRSMRGDLERDARARDATVAEAIEAYRRGEEPAIGRSPVALPHTGAAPHAADPAAAAAPASSPAGAPPKSSAGAPPKSPAGAPAQGAP